MKQEDEIEFCSEPLIHEDVVRKVLSEQPEEEQLADLADLFKNFLLYLTLFPQLVAGPIVRYSTIEKEIEDNVTASFLALDADAQLP